MHPRFDNDDFLSFQKGFSMAAASDLNNFVLTAAESKVYSFGSALKDRLAKERKKPAEQSESSKVHFTDFKLIEGLMVKVESENKKEGVTCINKHQVKYVSSGPKHSILVASSSDKSVDGLAFGWGDNKNRRFGKLPKVEKKKTDGAERTMIEVPTVIEKFQEVFKTHRQEAGYRQGLQLLQKGNLLDKPLQP